MSSTNQCHWDDSLEGAARQIAEVDHSPLRVLAGPGTGKTFALMRRAARILENGADPKRILVCTFTRTAAADLEKEVACLETKGVEKVLAGTLHSLCFRLLARADVLELTGRVPRPLLDFEDRFLLEDLQGEGFGGIRDRGKRLQAFNAAWARLQTDQPGWPSDPTDREFHRSLLGWLRFHEAMLVGEIVPETLNYLRNNPASPDRRRFDHVLVDEYQDLNRAEQELLDLLSEAGTISVVGDENQSIYSFKFAHPEGIATFDKTHPQTYDISLVECRRCPTEIVEMANSLIRNNSHSREDLQLAVCGQNCQGEVHIVQWHSIEEEAAGIAEIIERRIRAGEVKPGGVLVLAPRRQFGYAVRDALNSLGVLAHSFFHEEALHGNPKKIADSQAQQAFTLLTSIANSNDRVALRCWCGFGSSSLRTGAWHRLHDHCAGIGETPWSDLEKLASGEISISHTGDIVSRFKELHGHREPAKGLRGNELVDFVFPKGEPWAASFRAIASNIEGDEFTASALREALRVGITQPELPTDVDYIRVMSLHKSKGLTADLVVVVGCMQGLIPFVDMDLPQPQRDRALEEQRRLFYVAITRTRRMLVLSNVIQLPRDLAHRIGALVIGGSASHASTIASKFLTELGPLAPKPVLGRSLI
jgi:DNA helicase II / ATP-dependent DNA helicase PcrA